MVFVSEIMLLALGFANDLADFTIFHDFTRGVCHRVTERGVCRRMSGSFWVQQIQDP